MNADPNTALFEEAIRLYNAHSFAQAFAHCRRLLASQPNFAPALHLAGLCQWRSDVRAAAAYLRKAAILAPNDSRLHTDLGSVEMRLGRFREACERFERAVVLAPGVAENHFKLGLSRERLECFEVAEGAYRKAIAFSPGYAPAHAELAGLLEQLNRIDEARECVSRALALDRKGVKARMVAAQLDLRAGRFELAAQILTGLLEEGIEPADRALVQARLGLCLDRLGRYDEAYVSFVAANRLSAQTAALPVNDSGLETIARVRRAARALLAADSGTQKSAGEDLIFLVGFPRSGTTLLDRMLAAHPRLRVLEEKTNLPALFTDFLASNDGLQCLAEAREPLLERCRGMYRQQVARVVPGLRRDQLLVDKLPLNTMLMPLIHRLFPAARFILPCAIPETSFFPAS